VSQHSAKSSGLARQLRRINLDAAACSAASVGAARVRGQSEPGHHRDPVIGSHPLEHCIELCTLSHRDESCVPGTKYSAAVATAGTTCREFAVEPRLDRPGSGQACLAQGDVIRIAERARVRAESAPVSESASRHLLERPSHLGSEAMTDIRAPAINQRSPSTAPHLARNRFAASACRSTLNFHTQ